MMKRRSLVRPRESDGGIYFASEKENIEFIPSGCVLLDCVLGGGWPLGRVVNIVGDKSTGKTLLAMEAVANFFLKYPEGSVWYNEAESAFDADYAKALGIPFDRVSFIQDCETVEQLFDSMARVVRTKGNTPGLYILDSLDSLSDKAEQERGIDEASYGGAKAKKMSEFFRRTVQSLKRTKLCLMIISQVRDNIGVTFGRKHTRSGGKALDFYASQVLWLAYTGAIERQVGKVKRSVGIKIKAKADKNKVGLPFRECNFWITFGYGVDDVEASCDWLSEIGHPVGKVLPSPDELRKIVMENWYRIEKSFLPAKQKYGS